MTHVEPTPDDAARATLKQMRWQAGTLFRALDLDGDGRLSPAEIDAAPEVLRRMADSDGCLRESALGGATVIPYMIRRSGILRLLDPDGDLVITPRDIADAPARIRRLDSDQDGYVTADDDLPDLSQSAENRMPMGTASQMLAYQTKMFSRTPEMTGPLPPQGEAAVQPGYLLIQEVSDRGDVQKSHKTLLMDEHGKVAHVWPTPQRLPEATVTYLLDDGNLLRTTCKHDWLTMDGQFPIGANGTVSIVAPDGRVLWEWSNLEFGKEALHHDVEMMPNGNILAISWDILTAEQARARGWAQQGARDRIVLDKIYELKPDLATGGTDVVWCWRMVDHIVQNRDATAPGFGNPADHPEKIDINWPQLDEIQFNSGQLLHTNAVSYNEKDDVILISSAIFGEIWAIDHSTTAQEVMGSTGGRYGRGGDLIWRWGNPQTWGQGGPEDQELFWQHDAHWLRDDVPHQGDVLVFNNGMRRSAEGSAEYGQICMGMITGAYSDILEISLPRDANGMFVMGEGPFIEWSFNTDGAEDIYSPFMSNAQRQRNGNTLMVQACDKRIVEVTADDEIVLDFHVGGPGRMYRIYKYPRDHPGIRALGL
ncbi:aryl-sulfate sulfotransferase [Marinovum sp. 2_MG-2023]|uniref:aryl-sulfate sulfotransferase n=1 Tax=unclassified Marinovum TaxID=2647166 RepID=UPI0026E25404|nr:MULTISPECIES: aryl-sulfate sulfotransferase [unclassified Marinovum]MDO6729186.1 aryl-sulfate sulfotransferase [Marinovum sp. 2_MG-2023]MDO6779187.1 aryl-sulfate sulfotransferase [Marinovum sp. 1_MG-2023]